MLDLFPADLVGPRTAAFGGVGATRALTQTCPHNIRPSPTSLPTLQACQRLGACFVHCLAMSADVVRPGGRSQSDATPQFDIPEFGQHELGAVTVDETDQDTTHSRNAPFACNVCKRSYSRVDHLARHHRSRKSFFSCHFRIYIFKIWVEKIAHCSL